MGFLSRQSVVYSSGLLGRRIAAGGGGGGGGEWIIIWLSQEEAAPRPAVRLGSHSRPAIEAAGSSPAPVRPPFSAVFGSPAH